MGKTVAASEQLHIVMIPWFAYGHILPYFELSNKLAEKGHKITLVVPNKVKLDLEPKIRHPSLISLHAFTVPHIEPLPPGTETCSDVPIELQHHLAVAMDRARPEVESIISAIDDPKPDLLFYDNAYWVPEIATKLGMKSVFYQIACALSITRIKQTPSASASASASAKLFTLPKWVLTPKVLGDARANYGEGITYYQRVKKALSSCDAIALRTCREIEGESSDILAAQYNKPVFLTGPVLPEVEFLPPLDNSWAEWLAKFGPKSVVLCCFGSQYVPDKAQLQEMALALEDTGLPFLMSVKPPTECATIEEALPEGFSERVKERGVVHGGWVQQLQILAHPSVGCFICHCGYGSMWEGLLSDNQLVLLPQLPDQLMMAQMLAEKLKVGVMVDREEDDGWVSRKNLCQAVKSVMDPHSEFAALLKNNHANFRDKLLTNGFMANYLEVFDQDLKRFLTAN
ncbi:hypothetical protein SOVF_020820 [Spinacia oleracea]|uniref:Glycosyltransferase n=1 Tax=Spinacia oleracea TaxID=3562 RepID=A0A9R0JQB1_SPIOL|nr:anthocyanidin 3-O-glucoside 2'''-O-xylosyltransferase-like [Spinacia oleracea]KNA23861.1 hypothetical protein SOVF_020820 [Spinacia oleracea]